MKPGRALWPLFENLNSYNYSSAIRSVSQIIPRINEAEKLGFKHCILPKNSCKNLKLNKSDMEIIPVSTLKEALDIILGLSIKQQGTLVDKKKKR